MNPKTQLDPQVFVRATECITDRDAVCCCNALWQALGSINRAEPYVQMLKLYFRKQRAPLYWWGTEFTARSQFARQLALLLCAEMLRHP